MATEQDNKVIDINRNGQLGTGKAVNIYRESPKLLLHPILRARRKRLKEKLQNS